MQSTCARALFWWLAVILQLWVGPSLESNVDPTSPSARNSSAWLAGHMEKTKWRLHYGELSASTTLKEFANLKETTGFTGKRSTSEILFLWKTVVGCFNDFLPPAGIIRTTTPIEDPEPNSPGWLKLWLFVPPMWLTKISLPYAEGPTEVKPQQKIESVAQVFPHNMDAINMEAESDVNVAPPVMSDASFMDVTESGQPALVPPSDLSDTISHTGLDSRGLSLSNNEEGQGAQEGAEDSDFVHIETPTADTENSVAAEPPIVYTASYVKTDDMVLATIIRAISAHYFSPHCVAKRRMVEGVVKQKLLRSKSKHAVMEKLLLLSLLQANASSLQQFSSTEYTSGPTFSNPPESSRQQQHDDTAFEGGIVESDGLSHKGNVYDAQVLADYFYTAMSVDSKRDIMHSEQILSSSKRFNKAVESFGTAMIINGLADLSVAEGINAIRQLATAGGNTDGSLRNMALDMSKSVFKDKIGALGALIDTRASKVLRFWGDALTKSFQLLIGGPDSPAGGLVMPTLPCGNNVSGKYLQTGSNDIALNASSTSSYFVYKYLQPPKNIEGSAALWQEHKQESELGSALRVAFGPEVSVKLHELQPRVCISNKLYRKCAGLRASSKDIKVTWRYSLHRTLGSAVMQDELQLCRFVLNSTDDQFWRIPSKPVLGYRNMLNRKLSQFSPGSPIETKYPMVPTLNGRTASRGKRIFLGTAATVAPALCLASVFLMPQYLVHCFAAALSGIAIATSLAPVVFRPQLKMDTRTAYMLTATFLNSLPTIRQSLKSAIGAPAIGATGSSQSTTWVEELPLALPHSTDSETIDQAAEQADLTELV